MFRADWDTNHECKDKLHAEIKVTKEEKENMLDYMGLLTNKKTEKQLHCLYFIVTEKTQIWKSHIGFGQRGGQLKLFANN
jgi:hypothetical protein